MRPDFLIFCPSELLNLWASGRKQEIAEADYEFKADCGIAFSHRSHYGEVCSLCFVI